MAVDAGSGSKIPPNDSGAGSPTPGISGDTGAGSPTAYSSSSGPQLGIVPKSKPFGSEEEAARLGNDAAYSEDGGALVELVADWPTAGPFGVRLRDATGALFPGADLPCLAGIPGDGRDVFANASQRYIRFALPKLKRGTYDIIVSWEGGSTVTESALRVVPRQVPMHTTAMLVAFGTSPQLERRIQDVA